VRSGLRVAAPADSAVERYLARLLAARAAEVRWGEDAVEELLVRSDTTVRVAMSHLPRLGSLLAAPPR
jgi:hypothetical protein